MNKVYTLKCKGMNIWTKRKGKYGGRKTTAKLSEAALYPTKNGPIQTIKANKWISTEVWEIKEYLIIDLNDKQTIVKLALDSGLITFL